MARVTVTMADRGTATMAAMPLLITAGIRRATAMATLQHITVGIRLAMLQPTTVLGTAASFVPPTRTAALVTTAGIAAGEVGRVAEVAILKGR